MRNRTFERRLWRLEAGGSLFHAMSFLLTFLHCFTSASHHKSIPPIPPGCFCDLNPFLLRGAKLVAQLDGGVPRGAVCGGAGR